MNSTWISREELIRASGWSERTIDRKCKRGELSSRPVATVGRRGRPPLEYDALCLPPEIQNALSSTVAPAIAPTVLSDVRLPICELGSKEIQQRYQMIRDFINFCNREATMGALLIDGKVIQTRAQMAEHVAATRSISVATVWRLYKAWKSPQGLQRRVRRDKGTSRFFERFPKAATLAAYVYLEQRQSATCVHEAIARDRELLGIPEQELPSYTTVLAWLKSIPPVYRTLAREGRRVYRERMAPYVSRNYDTAASNEIWVSDHMIHDVEVQNDCFHDAPIGAPIRLRFTCLLDWHSRYVVGWSWAWEGSSRSITTALRNAVAKYGPPAMLYCDNGKDYLKIAKGAMPAYLRSEIEPSEWFEQELSNMHELGVLARLGISVQHCIVRHPQSKHVERFFRTLHERFDKKFPTYTGGSPASRPDFTAEAMANHRKLLRMGKPEYSLHPPASAFMQMCNVWIEEHYHRRQHSGRSMRSRTPADVFQQDRWKNARPIPDIRDLAILLLERERRSVRECAVTLNKRRYIGSDAHASVVLHELNEQEVLVAFDPLDPDVAAVLDLDGRLLAMIKPERFLPQSSAANEAIAASLKERQQLEKKTADTIRSVRDQARANGSIGEVEHLARRAMPVAVGENITQRRARPKPDNKAFAPPSAAFIARFLLEEE